MGMTNNKTVLDWIDQQIALCKPEKVVWIDGSEEQLEALRQEACATGEMYKLNQEKLPGCYLHRSDPTDVARVESRTFICCEKNIRNFFIANSSLLISPMRVLHAIMRWMKTSSSPAFQRKVKLPIKALLEKHCSSADAMGWLVLPA